MEKKNTRRYSSAKAKRIKTNRLICAAAVVFLAGVIMLITVQVRVYSQKKQIKAIEEEIQSMNASVSNLSLYIDQYHDLEKIEDQAEELGMQQPEDDQLRVITLSVESETAVQTASNIEDEDAEG